MINLFETISRFTLPKVIDCILHENRLASSRCKPLYIFNFSELDLCCKKKWNFNKLKKCCHSVNKVTLNIITKSTK